MFKEIVDIQNQFVMMNKKKEFDNDTIGNLLEDLKTNLDKLLNVFLVPIINNH